MVFPPGDKEAVEVTAADLARLDPDEFLNDTIIDYYTKCVGETSRRARARNRFRVSVRVRLRFGSGLVRGRVRVRVTVGFRLQSTAENISPQRGHH